MTLTLKSVIEFDSVKVEILCRSSWIRDHIYTCTYRKYIKQLKEQRWDDSNGLMSVNTCSIIQKLFLATVRWCPE
jgi:hypothetical protein